MLIFFLLVIPLSSCKLFNSRDNFDGGHEWIVPRPAAEIYLLAINENDQPVDSFTLWVLLDDKKIQSEDRFLSYDVVNGFQNQSPGELVLTYLGEVGGGHEILMDAPGPPIMRALIESQGYESITISLDELLFVSKYRIGKSEKELNGEVFELNVVEYQIVLVKE